MANNNPGWTHGPSMEPGGVRFRLWAPAQERVDLILESASSTLAMTPHADGFFETFAAGPGAGARYRFALGDGTRVPDPASRFQPEDVHGPSEVIDPAAYAWRASWSGIAWEDVVLYEVHVGAFTPEGTFDAAVRKLDYLARLGVTAVELMPVGDFPGRWGWGYDGVLPYAPDSSYGRPEDLKALVDAAHTRGIAVLLDVVYNHFGPDGNYLRLYAPNFFTGRHRTPWGDAINFDGPDARPVRDFVIENALYWIDDYRLDGLRLDAVHAIKDDSRPDILAELAKRVRASVDRPVHLLLENEDNVPELLSRRDCKPVLYTGQWNDDVHHVLHVAATRETSGYYSAYGETELLGRALAEGFAYQGQHMPYRGAPRGGPSGALPPHSFVAFIQNHDQIGNRAFGDRLSRLARPEAVRALASVYLLLPQIPMIFMGEEWGAKEPFLFFCDFEGDLAVAVRKGRREEFSRFPEFSNPDKVAQIPDPLDRSTFLASKLDWERLDGKRLAFYERLIKARRLHVRPLLCEIERGGEAMALGDQAVRVVWRAGPRRLVLDANLSDERREFPAGSATFFSCGDIGKVFGRWSVRWSLEP